VEALKKSQEERDRQLALMVITSFCSVKYQFPRDVPVQNKTEMEWVKYR
jgi:hypothetical protein